MNEKKFTPGPWRVFGGVRSDKGVQRGQSGGFMVLDDDSRERAEADAHLISAAPEMLAAIERSCYRCGWQDEFASSDMSKCPQVKTCLTAKAINKAHGITND